MYMQGDEFFTFHAVVESLLTLPPAAELGDHRSEFELLLHLLHHLGQALRVEHVSKGYRSHYSPDVQLCGYLYSTLLTAFTLLPSYVLNGQEFYVSDTVLDQCQSLQQVFQETCEELKRQFENLHPYSLEHIRSDVRRSLTYFDRSWCRFEMPALEEIEAIHRQACRPLIEAIEIEKALSQWESRGSVASRTSAVGAHTVRVEAHQNRLMEKINELNRLANVDGKGRCDMDLTCVIEAERVAARPPCTHNRSSHHGVGDGSYTTGSLPSLQRCGISCSPPVLLRIARMLLKSLSRLRRVLQRYGRCLYQLNSHLANNSDLVRSLEMFESSWETANRYLVQAGARRLALLAYDIVSSVKEPSFVAALTSLDPGFLVATLPRLFIIHEMRRWAKTKVAATDSVPTMGVVPASKRHKESDQCQADNCANSILPRPLDARATPSTAFQHSLIARAFLPQDAVSQYNETAVALDQLGQAQFARLRGLLLDFSPAPSAGSTPLAHSTTPKHRSSPPIPAKAPTPLPSNCANDGAPASSDVTPACTAPAPERPPRTPCPPRMAVPNSSCGRPPDAGRDGDRCCPASLVPPSAPDPEDSDDEDETPFSINFASLQTTESEGYQAATLSTPTAQEGPTGGDGDPGVVQQALASISTLALLLQRTKAHEWNELIQVVIQGLMLAKSAPSQDTPAPKEEGRRAGRRAGGRLL